MRRRCCSFVEISVGVVSSVVVIERRVVGRVVEHVVITNDAAHGSEVGTLLAHGKTVAWNACHPLG